jgi:hypothetical protein
MHGPIPGLATVSTIVISFSSLLNLQPTMVQQDTFVVFYAIDDSDEVSPRHIPGIYFGDREDTFRLDEPAAKITSLGL